MKPSQDKLCQGSLRPRFVVCNHPPRWTPGEADGRLEQRVQKQKRALTSLQPPCHRPVGGGVKCAVSKNHVEAHERAERCQSVRESAFEERSVESLHEGTYRASLRRPEEKVCLAKFS
jgi:hypothetical protein